MDVIFHFSRAVSIMSFADSVIIDFVLIIQVAFGLNTVLDSWCSPHEFPDWETVLKWPASLMSGAIFTNAPTVVQTVPGEDLWMNTKSESAGLDFKQTAYYVITISTP